MTTSNEQSDMTNPGPNTPDAPIAPKSNDTMKWVKRGAIGLVALVALVYAGIFFYANVLNDSPDALDENDLSAALAEPTDDTTPAAPATDAPIETTAEEPAAEPEPPVETVAPATEAPVDTEAAAAVEGFDGIWAPTTASEFGYRVDEILGGVNVTAVGRSNEIEGSLTVEGTTASVDVVVQVENITSDNGTRDGQFRGRIMDVANFPTATFRTTEPVDFGNIPATGESVTATAVGELTLKGVTQPVTLEVTAQSNGENIGVLGNIPITFTDYGIDNPSNAGVSLEDEGVVEFVLVFERS